MVRTAVTAVCTAASTGAPDHNTHLMHVTLECCPLHHTLSKGCATCSRALQVCSSFAHQQSLCWAQTVSHAEHFLLSGGLCSIYKRLLPSSLASMLCMPAASFLRNCAQGWFQPGQGLSLSVPLMAMIVPIQWHASAHNALQLHFWGSSRQVDLGGLFATGGLDFHKIAEVVTGVAEALVLRYLRWC